MSKIVCDVCGTSFAESEDQCPICGTAKTEATQSADGDGGHGFVKGGRFAPGNVRRQNRGNRELPCTAEEDAPVEEMTMEEAPEEKTAPPVRTPRRSKPENEQPSNLGLIIIVVVLLVAIIALCAYIGIYVYDRFGNTEDPSDTGSSSSNGPFAEIPCESISVAGGLSSHSFDELGQEWMVEILCNPADTTDILHWDYNDQIVSVTANGKYWIISPVGIGETVITVSCGEATATLNVICDLQNLPCTGVTIDGPDSYTFTSAEPLNVTVSCWPSSTTDEITWQYDETVVSVTESGGQWVITPLVSGATTVVVTCGEYSDVISITVNLEANFVLELRKTDITMTYYGEKYKIYNGTVDASKITWRSDNEEVATVENGVITAVGSGKCMIYAEYGNQTASCIVRCTKDVVKPVDTGFYLAQQYDTGNPTGDVTISVGEKLVFSIRASDGTKITEGVTFTVSDENYITVDANGRVTGVAVPKSDGRSFYVYVYAEYEGVIYECKIRVKAAN